MSNKMKLILGIVLVIIMIPAMGIMVVKDNLQNNNYCAACHEEYYVTWADPETEFSLAHEHYNMGVSCQTCHQRTLGESLGEVVNYTIGNYYYPLPQTELSMEKCFACHESYEKLMPPLRTEITKEDRNPHAGHWGELECSECHHAHQDSVIYCEQCHDPLFEGQPGYTSK